MFDTLNAAGGTDQKSPEYSTWPLSALSAEIRDLAGVRERTTVSVLLALASWCARAGFALDGAASPVAWLDHHTTLSRAEAADLVRMARLIAIEPRLSELLGDRSLTVAKVRILAAVAIPARRRIWDRDADLLINTALELNPDELKIAAQRWAELADDELNRGEPDDHYKRRRLWTNTHNNQGELHAYGPAADIAALEELLDRREPPDPTTGPAPARTLTQRRYDALVGLTGTALAGADGSVDPDHTINVVLDYDTLLRLLGQHPLPGTTTTDLTRWTQQLLNGPTLTDNTTRRLLCTNWISRLILGPDGQILDQGRRTRLFTPNQKRAIQIRDGGCVFPGCNRPPQWCDIHHLDPWNHNGPTNTDNGACLCRYHHTLIHEGNWTLTRQPDGTWHAQPPPTTRDRPVTAVTALAA